MFKLGRFEFTRLAARQVNKIALLCSFLFVLAGLIVSLGRFWQYEVFYYDFGIFDRVIWEVAHFRPPIVDHLVVGGKWIFADHFYPSVFLLSPLYWFTDRQEALLIVQSIAVGLSGFVIYLIGVKVLKNRLAAVTILLFYFLFLGLQNAVISDFHEVTVATLPLALTFYSLLNKKLKWFIVFGILTLGFKESLSILGVTMGIFIILFNSHFAKATRDRWFKIGFLTSVFSFAYGLLIIKFLIPYFSGGGYSYAEEIELTRFVTSFFDNPQKLEIIFKSFWSFSFLPVFSPSFWILIIQDFGVRYYSSAFGTRIGLGLHYSAILSVIMAVSSVYGLKFVSSKINRVQFKFLLIFVILNAIFLYRFVDHGPFALSYNPAFYSHTKDFEFLDKMVKLVPKNSTVMAQNNIASHFTHHKNVWILRMNYEEFNPDYILIDNRLDQSPNNFFGSDRNFDPSAFINKISNDRCYEAIYKTKYQFVFKKSC